MSVHLTAGFGDIGFEGHWTLEITVVKPVRIYAHMPVAQIYYMLPLSNVNRSYANKIDAKYSKQGADPVPSLMWKNFPLKVPAT
jgi:dCTP deaminase